MDGLLRVTAPHEWVILLGLVLALAAVALWGLLGTVERSLGADCALVKPDADGRYGEVAGMRVPDDSAYGLEVVALVPHQEAQRLDAGMDARVSTSVLGVDGPEILDAEVVAISARSVARPGGLLSSEPAAPSHGRLVGLALRSEPPAGLVDGAPCTARIVVDRHAPVRWLTSGRLG